MKQARILISLIFSQLAVFSQTPESIYDISVVDIEGNTISMEEYKGKVILIVNTASKCGFTPQYEGLETLYKQYKDEGLVILGFPSNDFLRQEPGSNEEINNFCTINFGVTFPMFSKVKVKGKDQAPLYTYLTSRQTNPDFSGKITWNFNKFLIDRNGQIVNRFGSSTKPLSEEITSNIKDIL